MSQLVAFLCDNTRGHTELRVQAQAAFAVHILKEIVGWVFLYAQ